jgi:hypothetical protein
MILRSQPDPQLTPGRRSQRSRQVTKLGQRRGAMITEEPANGANCRPARTLNASGVRVRSCIGALLIAAGIAWASGGFGHVFVNQLIDSSNFNYDYAYAPSIVDDGGVLYMFYCSSPTVCDPKAPACNTGANLDAIRYSTSPDGRRWSTPKVALRVSDTNAEGSTCDPSVVKNPHDGYWYLFYSGGEANVGTEIFVARAASIDGPYSKYTASVSQPWQPEATAVAPKPIIKPRVPRVNIPDGSSLYGAGQQTVVYKDDQFWMWYSDDTQSTPLGFRDVMFTKSADPTQWPTAVVGQGITTWNDPYGHESFDVKFDRTSGRFVMVGIPFKIKANSFLSAQYSSNGLDWSQPTVLCDASCFPDYGGNVGVSADAQAHLTGERSLAVYGAPYDLDCPASLHAPECWGGPGGAHWDLYGSALSPAGSVWNEIPWGWNGSAPAPASSQFLKGDFDGDGKTERAYVTADNRWYVTYSSTGQLGSSAPQWGITAGWQWQGIPLGSRYLVADYDGDGKADRALVTPVSDGNKWYVIYSSTGSHGSSAGTWGIPWGWPWQGVPAGSRFLVADYDGDGKADRALVTPVSDGNKWYVIYSSTGSHGSSAGTWGIPWGWPWQGVPAGSRFLVADYDGDGKADRALVTPVSDGNKWYVIYSSTGSLGSGAASWGIPWGWSWQGVPVGSTFLVADYDGDGKADRALVTPVSDGNRWYVIYSSTGGHGSGAASWGIPWGWPWQGVPVGSTYLVADYDGDHKVDRALATPSSDLSKWYVLPSTGFHIY